MSTTISQFVGKRNPLGGIWFAAKLDSDYNPEIVRCADGSAVFAIRGRAKMVHKINNMLPDGTLFIIAAIYRSQLGDAIVSVLEANHEIGALVADHDRSVFKRIGSDEESIERWISSQPFDLHDELTDAYDCFANVETVQS